METISEWTISFYVFFFCGKRFSSHFNSFYGSFLNSFQISWSTQMQSSELEVMYELRTTLELLSADGDVRGHQ